MACLSGALELLLYTSIEQNLTQLGLLIIYHKISRICAGKVRRTEKVVGSNNESQLLL